jgi:penicillin-binding protein 1A
VGNYKGAPGGLDRATQARRQPGSTFKPIVYSYALHTRRFNAASLLETRSTSIAGYRPLNFEESEGSEPARMREAVAKSINVAAVHVARDVGVANVVSWARALGITSNLGADLSLALGSYEVAPIEMANTYATFASGGIYDTPRFIQSIVDSHGKQVPIPAPPPSRRVMEEGEAFLITNILQSVVDHGTGRKAKVLNRPVAGKTGTSNKAKDAWFVGYSTDLSCAVWTGYDDATPLGRREAGSTAALPAWVAFMKAAHKGRPPTDFPRPPDVVTVRIDPTTGLLPQPDQEDTMEEFFLRGTEPTEVAELDAGVDGGDADIVTEDGGVTMPQLDKDAETLPALPQPEDPVPLF